MRRPLIALVATLLALSACSSDDGGGDDAASTTVTTPDATSTTAPSPTGSVPAECPENPASDEASPTPNQGAPVTDGRYFGFITFLDAEDLSLRFDVAQLLTGDAAAKAAAEDGGEADNDYWVRNASKAARTLKLAEDATLCAPTDDSLENTEITLADLNRRLGDGEPYPTWIDVRSGTVERVQHQYFP